LTVTLPFFKIIIKYFYDNLFIFLILLKSVPKPDPSIAKIPDKPFLGEIDFIFGVIIYRIINQGTICFV